LKAGHGNIPVRGMIDVSFHLAGRAKSRADKFQRDARARRKISEKSSRMRGKVERGGGGSNKIRVINARAR